MNKPLNMFGEPVDVGDTVVITTTSWKNSTTRVARVVRFEQGPEIKHYDYAKKVYVPTGTYKFRVFVRLYKRDPVRDPATGKYKPGLYKFRPYVKEIFGIRESVKVDPATLPDEVQEVLNGRK